MNLDDYAYQEDDRWYVNPQVSLDEQNNFINTLRQVESRNNDQIVSQTRGLGTQIPSQLGGLGGGSSYFRSRYQTPQTNHAIADLRASAQSQALNTMLSNEIEKAKKQYQDAYRAANVRQSNLNNNTTEGEVLFKPTDDETNPEDPDTITKVTPTGPRTTGYYYITADGTKVPFTVSGIGLGGGTVLDTGMLSTGKVYQFLENIIRAGGKIYAPNGMDITSDYSEYF